MVENETEEILLNADKEDVAFLVVGDPFGATTHTDLILRAREKNIKVRNVTTKIHRVDNNTSYHLIKSNRYQ